MDDLVGQKYSLVGKLSARFIGEVEREVHAVAEAELLGQTEYESPHLERVALRLYALDKVAVVIGYKGRANLIFKAETSSYDSALRIICCAHLFFLSIQIEFNNLITSAQRKTKSPKYM
jgi:hypothetical protein